MLGIFDRYSLVEGLAGFDPTVQWSQRVINLFSTGYSGSRVPVAVAFLHTGTSH